MNVQISEERLFKHAKSADFYNQVLMCLLRGTNCIFKAETIHVQAWIGREGSRRVRLPDLMTIDT